MSSFCGIEFCGWFNVDMVHASHNAGSNSLLLIVEVEYSRPVLSFGRIGATKDSPLCKNRFIIDKSPIKFDQDTFSMILHSRVGWILLHPSRISNNASLNAIDSLEFWLGGPESSFCCCCWENGIEPEKYDRRRRG